ncbi:MAG: hypothetical protein KatS3mg034_0196 [Vicingaceae bacterium]|nr:MAG: hypothetical protein KatS3mg034_0196 [Vicingaceae bacterium]
MGFSSNSQNPSIPNASTAASGTYTVTVTGSNGCINSATTNVTVNPLPNPNPSSNSPICAGQTLNLNAAAGMTSYSWSGPNGFSANSQNPSIPNASTAASGTYTVTVTDANGCSNTASINVLVNASLSLTPSSNSPICQGQTLNLSVSPNGLVSYSWTGPNGYSSNQQNPTINNATIDASGTYSVTAIDANGCQGSATINVTVNPLPTPTASSNSPICAGQTLNLSASGGVSYSWSGPNGFSANSQNPSIPNASAAASGTYTVTVTDANGCSNSATTNVTVNPLPNPTASSNSPICSGQTLNLSATGGVSYSWSGPNGFSANSQNPSIPNASTAASGTYTVTVTDANGCSNTATTNVTVNPLPNPTASSNSPICSGQTLNLSATGGVSYSWSGPNGFSANSQNPSIPNASTAASGTYTVTVTDANGCSNTATTNVTVNPLPNPTASSNSPICSGQTLNLSASGGVSYSWSGPNGFSANSQNPSIPNASTAASGTYTVTVTDANGCSNTATTNVTVNPLPNPTASSNSPICSGQTLNLSATGGVSYSWSGPNGFSANSQNPSIPNASTAASGTYTVTVTDANGCSNTATTNVTVNPLPNPTASSNSPICSGQTLNLSASGGVSYSWSGPNGFSANSQNPSIPNASTAASGTYTVTVTDANGCSNSATTNVTVNPLPVPAFSVNVACPNSATAFVNNSSIPSGSIASYFWSMPGGTPASSNASNPSTVYPSGGSYTVTLIATSNAGCVDSTSLSFNVPFTPVANFSADTVCEGNTTCFTDLSSVTNGTISQWAWNFGDGSPADNSQNPCHAYASTGFL